MRALAFYMSVVVLDLIVTIVVLLVLRRIRGTGNRDRWPLLALKVLALLAAANAILMIPYVRPAALIVWIVGLKKISGLEVLDAVFFVFMTGILCLAGTIVLARWLEMPLGVPEYGEVEE